jgi:rare lipoprotein A
MTNTITLLAIMASVSFYGPGFDGRRTASGQIFNQNAMTAAHRSLPFGTKLRLTNRCKKSIVVVVNDRGPFVGDRILDLSLGAFRKLFSPSQGVGRVKIERI